MGSCGQFFRFFFASFSTMVFERIFLGFWRGFGGQNGCQNQFWECFLRCFSGGQLGIDFFVFLKIFFKARTLIFVRIANVL